MINVAGLMAPPGIGSSVSLPSTLMSTIVSSSVTTKSLTAIGAMFTWIVAVATDEVDSLADDGSFGELLDEAPDQDRLEYAALSLVSACGPSALFVATDDVVRSVTTSEDDASTEDTDFVDRATAYRGWVDRVGIFACELTER